MESVYGEYLINLLEQEKEREIDTEKIRKAIKAFADSGSIRETAELVRDFLRYSSTRDAQGFEQYFLEEVDSVKGH